MTPSLLSPPQYMTVPSPSLWSLVHVPLQRPMFHSNFPCSIPTEGFCLCGLHSIPDYKPSLGEYIFGIENLRMCGQHKSNQYPCAENNTLRNDYNQPHPMISLWYSKYCSTVMGQLHTQQSLHQQWCRMITFPDSAEPGTFFSVNGIL